MFSLAEQGRSSYLASDMGSDIDIDCLYCQIQILQNVSIPLLVCWYVLVHCHAHWITYISPYIIV